MMEERIDRSVGPTAPSLAQSETKTMFFRRLGLDEGDVMHRHLYSLMKGEASAGWHRMIATRDSLTPSARQDPTVEPPYAFNQMDEEALQREVLEIYRRAKSETRILYDLGWDVYLGKAENWIIRWLLWHVFRYRDDRNKYQRRTARMDDVDAMCGTLLLGEHASGSSTPTSLSLTEDSSTQLSSISPPSCKGTKSWYDPVRGVYRT